MELDGGVTYRALAVLVTRSSAGIKGSTESSIDNCCKDIAFETA